LAFVADFGTLNFNLKNKFDMENKTSTNHENGNDANRLLAVMLISLVWMAVLAVGVILAIIFNGEQFVIRCILIQPFSIGAVFASRSVWKHYR
jgi:flagellar basal body-associated protein FliL